MSGALQRASEKRRKKPWPVSGRDRANLKSYNRPYTLPYGLTLASTRATTGGPRQGTTAPLNTSYGGGGHSDPKEQ